ncbi:glycosyltransferase family 2 protein [Synechococcus sp. CBW1108]|nr:glycosyltransferase family 2 protein [Synechococcus sp. CBW1108]
MATIVAFTDDDCPPESSWLEMLVTAVRANHDALVGGSTMNGLPESLFAETSQLIINLVLDYPARSAHREPGP